eukprot:2686125-Rhodomonas_salina.2
MQDIRYWSRVCPYDLLCDVRYCPRVSPTLSYAMSGAALGYPPMLSYAMPGTGLRCTATLLLRVCPVLSWAMLLPGGGVCEGRSEGGWGRVLGTGLTIVLRDPTRCPVPYGATAMSGTDLVANGQAVEVRSVISTADAQRYYWLGSYARATRCPAILLGSAMRCPVLEVETAGSAVCTVLLCLYCLLYRPRLCYAMSGTDLAYGPAVSIPAARTAGGSEVASYPIGRLACYAMPGTDLAYRTTPSLCAVQYGHTLSLRACYALSGTDVGCIGGGGKRRGCRGCALQDKVSPAISYRYLLRARYAMSDTGMATVLRPCYAISGTDLAYRAT